MCNGCEDLEPTLSELNECSCREIICCDGESACNNRTSTVGQVLNEKLLRVILVDISNYFSVYFDLITGRISPTLHLQLNNRRDRFSVLRRRSEVVNSRSWMHNWRKMWSCVAEVELVSCEPLRMVLLVIFWKQTKDKEIWRWIERLTFWDWWGVSDPMYQNLKSMFFFSKPILVSKMLQQ